MIIESFDIDLNICGELDCEYTARTLFNNDNYIYNFINSKPDETLLILNIAKQAINNVKFKFEPMPKYLNCDISSNDLKDIFDLMDIKNDIQNILEMKSDMIIFDSFGIIKYGLIKFILKSNLMEITSNTLFTLDEIKTYEVNYFDNDLKNFELHAKENSISYLYHGSNYSNWYSIIMNGLKIYSNTPQMLNGAAFGTGIYLSDSFEFSKKYSIRQNSNGDYLIGVFQVIGDINKYKKAVNTYVVDNPTVLKLKYILNINSKFINSQNIIDHKFNTLITSEEKSKTTYMASFRNKRFLKEINYVLSGKCDEFGFTFEINDENFYIWNVAITNIDKDSLLHKDMQDLNIESINIEIRFPNQYPLQPPFIRIVSPIFKFMTGHITSGGSICIELLTNQGWSPSYSIESLLVQIKATILENGSLECSRVGQSYSIDEAQTAFKRMLISHGWK
jgi:ubiquitin-conjugating enzyme E2 Q